MIIDTGTPSDGLDPANRFLERLPIGSFRPRGQDKWMCKCPAHEDRNPSLSVGIGDDGKLLLHCFAGCATEDIIAAVGLKWEELWPDDPERRCGRTGAWLNGFRSHPRGTPRVSEKDVQAASDALARRILPPTATRFTALDFPPMSPVLGPFCRQQSSLIFAPAGAGKTMFALGLAHAMAEGHAFCGWPSHERCRVLYVDGEMAGVTMQERLMGAQSFRLHVANIVNWGAQNEIGHVNIATEEGQALINYWADELEIDYLFLDNVMSLVNVPGVSVNSDEFWQPVERLLMMQRSRNRGIVMVDHANMSGSVHGTKTKTWRVDHTINISPVLSDPVDNFCHTATHQTRIRVQFEKVRVPRVPGLVGHGDRVVTLRPVGHPWDSVEADDVIRSQAREMKENGMSIRDISEELGIAKSTAHRWLK